MLIRAKDAEVREQRRADVNWRKAFEALDQVCLRMAEERMPRESQPSPADRELISKLLNFYEEFVRENGSDPAVRHQAARACQRVGDLCRKLGRPAEAIAAYRRSVERGRALVDEFPNDATYRADLAAALDRLGFALKNAGDLPEAEEATRASLGYRDEFATARPMDRKARRE